MLISRILTATGAAALLAAAAAIPARAADDEGAKVYQDTCVGCHSPTGLTLEEHHLSRAEWKEAVDRMAEMNRIDPPLKKDRYEKLLDWLAATHGPAPSPTEPKK